MVLSGSGEAVLGWKIGRIPAVDVDRLNADRLAGPIRSIGEAECGEAPIFTGGAGAIEAEFMLRLAHIPERAPRTDPEARALVDLVCAGIEVASSPIRTIHDHAPFDIIADLGINNGNLLGAEFALDSDFDRFTVTTRIYGEPVGTGRACDVLDGPFGAVRFLVALHLAEVLQIEPGQWISAGAITGVHPISVGQRAEIDFGGRATMVCTAVAEKPHCVPA